MKSRHRCPACNNFLSVAKEDSTVVVFCGVGRCPSYKANNGIKGTEPEDVLAKKLIAQLLQDPDWPE